MSIGQMVFYQMALNSTNCNFKYFYTFTIKPPNPKNNLKMFVISKLFQEQVSRTILRQDLLEFDTAFHTFWPKTTHRYLADVT
jgi:hypothetical protein